MKDKLYVNPQILSQNNNAVIARFEMENGCTVAFHHERTVDRLNGLLDAWESWSTDVMADMVDLENQVNQQDTHITRLEKRLKSLQSGLEFANNITTSALDQRDNTYKKNRELEDECDDLQDQVDDLVEQLASWTERALELEELAAELLTYVLLNELLRSLQ